MFHCEFVAGASGTPAKRNNSDCVQIRTDSRTLTRVNSVRSQQSSSSQSEVRSLILRRSRDTKKDLEAEGVVPSLQ
jgi:hypothetical protein